MELRSLNPGDAVARRLPKYCVEDTDRHGTVRVYLRLKGKPKKRLQGVPWTPAFMAAYQEALKGEGPQAPAVRTWGWLLVSYFKGAEFRRLPADRQRALRKLLEPTTLEPIAPDDTRLFRDVPLQALNRRAVKVLRDRKAGNTAAANNRLKAIRQALDWAMGEEYIEMNPARAIKLFERKTDGFYTWTVEDVLQYLAHHGPGSMAALALMILLYVGPRRSDAVKLGPQHAREGFVRYRPGKTKNSTGVWCEVAIDPELQAELDRHAFDRMTWLVSAYGRPFKTGNAFGNWFKDRCREAGLPHCSAHGLRKGGASLRAEGGATEGQLNGIYGWTTSAMASRYTKKARTRKLAEGSRGLIKLSPTECPTEKNIQQLQAPKK